MIDTHTHLNFKAFDGDWRKVVDRAVKAGVKKMIVVGTDVETSKKALQMTKEHPALYAAVGIHPHHVKQFTMINFQFSINDQLDEIERMIQNEKVVAVGEIGLDYHVYRNSKKYDRVEISEELVNLQKELFTGQVELAKKHNKPIIVHSRSAKDDVLKILLESTNAMLSVNTQDDKPETKGVFHCFEGSKKYARKIIESGFYISFTGNITYEQGRDEVSLEVPLEKLILETDCPYMTPSPLREEKSSDGDIWRNEPINVKITARKHSELRGINLEEIIDLTTMNAKKLFGI